MGRESVARTKREQLIGQLLAGKLHITNFKRIDDKKGGANSAGLLGGVYQHQEDPTFKVLLKQDTSRGWFGGAVHNVDKDIAEIVGGHIIKAVMGEYAADVGFVKTDNDANDTVSADGSTVMVASVWLGDEHHDCEDLYKYAYRVKRPGQAIPEHRPTSGEAFKPVVEFLTDENRQGFAKISIGSVLVRDFDIHGSNIVVEKAKRKEKEIDPDEEVYLRRIDFGGCLKGIEDELEPHSLVQHLPGFGPINHYATYDRSLRVNKAIADEMDRVSALPLDNSIEQAVDYVGKFYGRKPVVAFAERIGIANADIARCTDQHSLLQEIKSFLKRKINNRKTSLKQVALEIRIDVAIKKNAQNIFYVGDDFVGLVLNNPDYFNARLQDGSFHFRAEEHKGSNFFDRLFGFTRRKLTNLLIAKIQEIHAKQTKLQAIQNAFSTIGNGVIRHELTEKLYGLVFAKKEDGQPVLDEKTFNDLINFSARQQLVDGINALFLHKQRVTDTPNKAWLNLSKLEMPQALKDILKAMNPSRRGAVPAQRTILEYAITLHNVNLPSKHQRHEVHSKYSLKRLDSYDGKRATPLTGVYANGSTSTSSSSSSQVAEPGIKAAEDTLVVLDDIGDDEEVGVVPTAGERILSCFKGLFFCAPCRNTASHNYAPLAERSDVESPRL